MILTFWQGTYLSKFKDFTKSKDRDEMFTKVNRLIIQNFRDNIPMKEQIDVYSHFLNNIKDRKDKKKAIYRSDHIFCLHCLFALVKLKVIEEEDDPLNGFFYDEGLTRKRVNRRSRCDK
tara:strand:+ start:65 stop:421 length:357 start_codon:yes stop_codon:yes gene_type:complete